MAAAARSVASFSTGGLSAPASSRVGAETRSNRSGRYRQPSSARHSRGTVGAQASSVAHRGLDRRAATSSSVAPTTPASTSSTARSRSPAATAASTSSIDPGG
jgi:hypothetical protein